MVHTSLIAALFSEFSFTASVSRYMNLQSHFQLAVSIIVAIKNQHLCIPTHDVQGSVPRWQPKQLPQFSRMCKKQLPSQLQHNAYYRLGLQLLSVILYWQFHQNFRFPRHVHILAKISKGPLSTKWPNTVHLPFLLYGHHRFY